MANTSYLDVQHLTKSFGARVLMDDISFSIDAGQKVGLIARNGTGKSTLLEIIAGHEGYDDGSIVFHNDIRLGYLEQQPHFKANEQVLDACLGANASEERALRARQMLTQLRISDLTQPMGELSGGQQKRVALARALLSEPDFLILDEPTNHLDLDMTVWLEGYLGRARLTLLMVTHDRYFLDHVCDTIMELDDRTIYTYHGNYAYYLEKRQERIDNKRAEIQRANNLYRRELQWMRSTPQARSHKARFREDAFAELEVKAHQRIEERQMRLKASSVYIGSKIFECKHVSKKFTAQDGSEKIILNDFNYNFARFEKMGIVGSNGAGKSTFIKMLLGLLPPDSGCFDIGETVRFGYFAQEGLQIDGNEKVIDVITAIADYIDLGGGRRMTASQFLNYFMFSPEEQQSYVNQLSGGERRKLCLCTVLMRNPNFLVLDEPTNDLDIQSLQVLEQYLADFPGCVIVVSHDRYFMDKVVDHLLVFEGEGAIRDFPGNYTQYREWLSLKPKDEAKKTAEKAEESKKADYHHDTRRRMSYKEKREYEQLTTEIQALEQEQKQLEADLCSGKLSVDELTEKSKRLPQLKDELDEKEMRWLELSELE